MRIFLIRLSKKGFKLLEEGNFREKPYPGKTKIFLDT
jgi:hypothetical protein